MDKPLPIKGVILAAGYGTRFLPFTKTVPKEMLPLVEKPSIQFIIDEFLESGIRDILVITSRRKKALEDYLDREMELESVFRKENATAKLERIQPPAANFYFIRQREMLGTAHALMSCEGFAGQSPIVVAYPDDIMLGTPPCSRQLIQAWEKTVTAENPNGCTVLSVVNMPDEDVSRYGVVDPDCRNTVSYVRQMVEKPPPGCEPSHLVSLGRYLYTPDLFPVLHALFPQSRPGEFYQTEPINFLARQGRVIFTEFSGTRYDTGEPLGYLKAVVEYALGRPDLAEPFRLFLADTIRRSQET